jgi:hypothetical protein
MPIRNVSVRASGLIGTSKRPIFPAVWKPPLPSCRAATSQIAVEAYSLAGKVEDVTDQLRRKAHAATA